MLETHLTLVLRIVVGTLLGGVIGFERDRHGRPAGLRTHALVALASATFMVVSTHFARSAGTNADELLRADTSRIASSVVSGIGFLAGGAILRTGLTVRGLTTAAGLWLVSAIGLAAGGGMYVESVAATGIGVTILTVLRRFEDKDVKRVHRKISVELSHDGSYAASVLEKVVELGGRASHELYKNEIDQKVITLSFESHFPKDLTTERLLHALSEIPGVRRVRLQVAEAS